VREVPNVIEVRKSRIHGYGVFATVNIPHGRMLPHPHLPSTRGWKKFRGFNRSCHPNAIIQDEVHAVRAIAAGEEITLGYIIKECRCTAFHF
jgi:SET domain-containing protein